MITHSAYPVEPWSLRETELDLNVIDQAGSLFTVANGHIGLRGNLDEGEPPGLPGTYLNGSEVECVLPLAGEQPVPVREWIDIRSASARIAPNRLPHPGIREVRFGVTDPGEREMAGDPADAFVKGRVLLNQPRSPRLGVGRSGERPAVSESKRRSGQLHQGDSDQACLTGFTGARQTCS